MKKPSYYIALVEYEHMPLDRKMHWQNNVKHTKCGERYCNSTYKLIIYKFI